MIFADFSFKSPQKYLNLGLLLGSFLQRIDFVHFKYYYWVLCFDFLIAVIISL